MRFIHSQAKAWQPHIITIHRFDRMLQLTGKQMKQGFLVVKLKSLLRKFNGHHHDLLNRYKSSTTGVTSGSGTAYPPDFVLLNPKFSVCFFCLFVISLLNLLSFFRWSLHFLVSSNFSLYMCNLQFVLHTDIVFIR
jgi:hypothetical protein